MRAVFLFFLLFLTAAGCSIRYSDTNGRDTLVGFPSKLNYVEEAISPDNGISWRRLRRTGFGLDLSRQSVGIMIGYENLFLLQVEGEGFWNLSYFPDKGMRIRELKIPESSPAKKGLPKADIPD